MQQITHEIWLWNEIRCGNERALYQLYMQNYDRLFRYGLYTVSDRVRVMECINEIFTEIWTRRDRLPDVEKIEGYLFTIFKRKLSHKLVPDRLFYSSENIESIPTTESDYSYEELLIAMQTEAEMKARIQKALNKLTKRQKEMIRLRYFESFSLEDISEKLNLTMRTVYNTVHSAICMLRKEML